MMQTQDAAYFLIEKIRQQEVECAADKLLMKYQFDLTVESLKPINLIKGVFGSDDAKNSILDSAIGLTTGYLVKKTIVRSSGNPLLNILGTIVGMGITKMVTQHPDGIKSIGGKLLNHFFNKEKSSENS